MTIFAPRSVVVPLYMGDWQQRIAESAKAVSDAEARAKAAPSLPRMMHETEAPGHGPSPEVLELTAAHNALVAEAEEAGCLRVTVAALPRKKWAALVEAHPPRLDADLPEDVRENDKAVGVNESTFPDALLSFREVEGAKVTATITDIGDADMSIDDLLENVSSVQFTELYLNAFAMNRDTGPRPKALHAATPSPNGVEIGK